MPATRASWPHKTQTRRAATRLMMCTGRINRGEFGPNTTHKHIPRQTLARWFIAGKLKMLGGVCHVPAIAFAAHTHTHTDTHQ